MLSLLLELALRSLLLGATVWLGLRLIRPRDPRVHMTTWTVVLIASLAMPLMMRSAVVTISSAPPPPQIAQLIETVPGALLGPVAAPADLDQIPAVVSPVVTEAAASAPAHQVVSSTINRLAIATAIYVAVAGVLVSRLLLGILLTWRLVRAAAPMTDEWGSARKVRVSDVIGVPVTFGSTILLPPECMNWTRTKRRAVLLHERSHVARGDFYVLLLAGLNRALFWFSPFAWWQLRHLAELAEMVSDDAAIEVLADRPSYAHILLDLAGDVRQAPAGLAMARAGTVRQRVERILAASGLPVRNGWRRQALFVTALVPIVALCAGTIAYSTSQPGGRADAVASGLEAYVGWYELNAQRALAVTRVGDRLFAHETGGPRFELVGQGAQSFSAADGNAFIVFTREGGERASELVLQEPALGERHAKRIDAARGKAIEAVFARYIAAAPERFRDQTPANGSRAAVLQAITDLQRGTPDYDRMGSALAERTRAQLPRLQDMASALGPVELIFFRGVGPGGYDVYGVKFAKGSAELRVLMGDGGRTEDLGFRPSGDDTPGGFVSCEQEQTLKASSGTAPIRLVLFNASGTSLQLFALDHEGKRTRRIGLGDNRTATIMTYVSRPWVVANAAGQCLEIVLPGQRTRLMTVWSAEGGEPAIGVAARRSTPMPGSEEALLQYIEALRRGEPNYERMTPEVAASTRRQMQLNQAILAKLGAVRAVSFRTVTSLDNDMYMVYFAGGSAEFRIGLSQDGRIGRVVLGPQS